MACGSIFVLLVAVKLLLPGRMAQVNAKLTGMLEQNIDVQAVFSAVGRAVSGEADVDVALQDMYQAVFDPQDPVRRSRGTPPPPFRRPMLGRDGACLLYTSAKQPISVPAAAPMSIP